MSAPAKPASRTALALFLLLGLAALVGAGWVSVANIRFRTAAVRAEGTVVELEERTSSTGKGSSRVGRKVATWAPVYEFRDGTGRTNRVTSSSASRPASYQVGEKLSVLYQAGAPQDARIDSFWGFWQGPVVLGILGLFMTVVAVIGIARLARRG